MEYFIFRSACEVDLMKNVRQSIEKGWCPQGGVTTEVYDEETWYLQAMVREPVSVEKRELLKYSDMHPKSYIG